MDGYNVQNNLAIEYVSTRLVNILDPYDEMESGSVQEINTKKTAEKIRDKLIAQGNVNAAVFYDPITYINQFSLYDENKEAIDRLSPNYVPPTNNDRPPSSRDLLRAQVKDFIEWIKKEGIIKQ